MSYQCKELSCVFKALSDETRLKICSLLSNKEVCGCELLEEVHITQPTLSYHMKLLCKAKLANARRDGAWMRYTLNTNRVKELENFLKNLKNNTV